MLFDDTYQTLAKTSTGLFKDKGSKFIAYAYPLGSEAALKTILSDLRAEHPKARHFCWAMRLTADRRVFRFNDDGEPSGTAGRPILNTLLSANLTQVVIVVVRYFGGTLLGVPGLINAYKNAAIAAINENEILVKTINDNYEIKFDYIAIDSVIRIIKEEQITILSQQFNNTCVLRFEVRKTQLNQVLAKLEKIENIEINYLSSPD